MKYVVIGSLGHISKPLTQRLLKAGHSVTVISSHQDRAEEIILMGARAAIGSIEDIDFLTRTFIGADAVYTMVPPYFAASDWKQHIGEIAENYVRALQKSRVRNVVNLSSIGAHMPDGCGPVSGLYRAETALNKLEGVNVKHLRPAFFYTNFLNNLSMVRDMGIIGGNYGSDTTMILVHPDDIAAVAFSELNALSFRGKSIRYVASDERNVRDIAHVIGRALEKPELSWVNFSDEDTFAGLMQAGIPEEIARNYTEMGAAIRSGEMQSHYINHRPVELGKIKFEAFAKDFAQAYRQLAFSRPNIEG